MIESYFRAGIRLKWQAPGDVRPPVMDNAIVDSTKGAMPNNTQGFNLADT